jgi:hypothetical protein
MIDLSNVAKPRITADLDGSAARSRPHTLAYWVTTLVLGVECIVGGVLDLYDIRRTPTSCDTWVTRVI